MDDHDRIDDSAAPQRAGRRRKWILIGSVVALLAAVMAIGASLTLFDDGSRDGSHTSGSGTDDDDKAGDYEDELPKGIKVVDRGVSHGLGSDGKDIYTAGVVLENTSKDPVAMQVTFTLRQSGSSAEDDSRSLGFPAEDTAPAFITAIPGKKTGMGETYSAEDAPMDGYDHLQILARATKVSTDDGRQFEGLDSIVTEHPDGYLAAEALAYDPPTTVTFEVANRYPSTVTAAGIGVVYYSPEGEITGGWISRPGTSDGVENGAQESYEPGKSEHSMNIPVDSTVESFSDIKVFAWP